MRKINDKMNVTWSDLLPRGSAKIIHGEIGEVISLRQVQMILKERCNDLHGVLDIAERIGKEHQKKQKARKIAKKMLQN